MPKHVLLNGRLELYQRKGSPYWQCSTYLGDRNWRVTTREADFARAKDVAEDWYWTLLEKFAAKEIKPFRRFRIAAEAFLKEFETLTAGIRNPQCAKGHKGRTDLYLNPFFGDMPVDKIKTGTVMDFRVWRCKLAIAKHGKPAARGTLNNDIITLRMILATAERNGWIDHLPDLSEPFPKWRPISHRAWFSPEEYTRLCRATWAYVQHPPDGIRKALCQQLHDYVVFMANTGLRPDEARHLEFRDVAVDEDSYHEPILALNVRGKRGVGYWAQSAQDLVAALIMYVRIDDPETGSLSNMRKLLGKSAKDFRDFIPSMQLAGQMAHCPELDRKLERFTLLTADNKELNGIISTALTQTRWIDSRPISADLAKGKFDFGSLKKRKTTVYLILPPRYLATHAAWLRVLITSALMPLLRSVDDAEVPVLLMLDEFAALGHVQMIEKNMALMRGYGVKLWIVLQDLAQLKTLYKDRWESFIGNAGLMQSFAPQDLTTRDYLSKMSGKRLYWVTTGSTSVSASSGHQESVSKGTTENAQYLEGPEYWPQGLGAMDIGESVLFSRGMCRRAFLPDPEEERDLLGYCSHMLRARQEIEGRER